MVIVWNELAEGNREYAAGLVALNSINTPGKTGIVAKETLLPGPVKETLPISWKSVSLAQQYLYPLFLYSKSS